MITTLRALLPAVAFALSTPAFAETWVVDGSHSNAGFSVSHMTVSTVRGTFNKWEGTVDWDGKDVKTLKINATIDVSTIDTREEKRDEHLRSPDFFDAAKFPQMTFKSTSVREGKSGFLELVGDLTIRGVTKPVTFQMSRPAAPKADSWGNIKSGFQATGTINRQDFGLSWNKTLDAGGLVVGDDVTLTIDVELNQKK
jgi:polyisoprenoid-binding protein YceI